ncbi:MAG TPA: hypothetical protein VG013_22655 [Gemmataceae bacterium]|jgi:hypothetical protein|nr:hypothetical protein [Gemmataceae bacterium]
MGKVRTFALIAGAVLAPACVVGCIPYSMGIGTPIPVPPWVTERMDEKYCAKNDFRTPVMAPIREGFPPPLCEDPPDEAMILRAMPHVPRGLPYLYEQFRDNVEIVTERMVDRIDPPRFFPLIGPAQLHHCHWKCTIYYTETVESGYPFPFQCVSPRAEVVYIDKDHLHLFVGPNPQLQQPISRDLTGQ